MSPEQCHWKHPPSLPKYSDEQIADLIAYVRITAAPAPRPRSIRRM